MERYMRTLAFRISHETRRKLELEAERLDCRVSEVARALVKVMIDRLPIDAVIESDRISTRELVERIDDKVDRLLMRVG